MAPSSTRRERSTSTVKSTWPGVSMRCTSCPCHSKLVTADVMVMPRSRSSSIQSMTASPSWTSPILCVLPAAKSSRSVSVVFPASMWAMIPMLRMARIRFTAPGSLLSVSGVTVGRLSPLTGERGIGGARGERERRLAAGGATGAAAPAAAAVERHLPLRGELERAEGALRDAEGAVGAALLVALDQLLPLPHDPDPLLELQPHREA